jgi:hypothetical protein
VRIGEKKFQRQVAKLPRGKGLFNHRAGTSIWRKKISIKKKPPLIKFIFALSRLHGLALKAFSPMLSGEILFYWRFSLSSL